MGVPVTQCTLAWKQSVTTYLPVISVCPWCFILKLHLERVEEKHYLGTWNILYITMLTHILQLLQSKQITHCNTENEGRKSSCILLCPGSPFMEK